MKLVRELSLRDLILTALVMLLGKEGEHWAYYEQDPEWWELRLLTRMN